MKILKHGEESKGHYVGWVINCGYCKCQFEIESDREVKHDAGIDAATAYRYVYCPTCRKEVVI